MSSDHRRGRGTARPASQRRIVRVHSEGDVTELKYLGRWVQRRGSEFRISWGKTGLDPMGLVQEARKDVRDMRRANRRSGPPFDQVWCVFDRDDHANVDSAINEARQGGIHVAFSNPCFELWLVLHARDQSAALDSGEAQRLATSLGLVSKKNVPASAWQLLESGYAAAKDRAIRLDERHELNGSPPHSNPSSDVWRLVDVLRAG